MLLSDTFFTITLSADNEMDAMYNFKYRALVSVVHRFIK